ncbi:hypothetical protein PMZ80_008667 [Knufia obscura]|uniref:Uncharacterized protein n=1 Tax=Knufia obscura TaxID=1635080 RepID=A0ABR0RGI8_9EURO|nr:hypothetical protein PMZ80_008667 [Knufia obscura]
MDNSLLHGLAKKEPARISISEVEEGSNAWQRWRPLSLRRSSFFATIYLEYRHGAVYFGNNGDSLPELQSALVQYLPVVLAVTYGLWISVIDLDMRRLEPWYRLSNNDDRGRVSPLLCGYDTDFFLSVAKQAFRNRHWECFICITISVLATLILPALSSSMLAVTATTIKDPVSVTTTQNLISTIAQAEVLSANFLRHAYSVAWLGQGLPAFTTHEYALAPLNPADIASDGRNATLIAPTTRYWMDFGCSEPVSYTYDTTPLYGDAPANTVYIDDGQGCRVDALTDDMDLERGNYNNTWIATTQSFSTLTETWNGTCGERPGLSMSIFRRKGDPTIHNPPVFGPGGNATALFCEPHYYQEPVMATIGVDKHIAISYTSVGSPTELTANIFNSSHFESTCSLGASTTGVQEEIADQGNLWDDSRLLDLSITSTYSPMFAFGVGLNSLPAESYLQPGQLRSTYTKAYQLAFAVALGSIFEPANQQNVSAVLSSEVEAVHLIPEFAIASQVLLVAIAGLCLLLEWRNRRRALLLTKDPESLAEVMCLAQDPGLQSFFYGYHAYNAKYLHDSLGPSAIRLETHGSMQPLLKVAETPDAVPTTEPTTVEPIISEPKHPFEVSQAALSCAIALTILSVVSLYVLEAMASKSDGLHLPSNNRFVTQIILNLLPTGLATAQGAYMALVCRLYSFLSPFLDLRRGNALSSSTLSVRYTSLLPQFLGWRAVVSGHHLLVGLSMATLLSTILPVSSAALFEQRSISSATSAAVQVDYLPKYTQHESELSLAVAGGPLSTGGGKNAYLVNIVNLTGGTPLPPWTSAEYGYIPVALQQTHGQADLQSYDVETVGYAADLQCVDAFSLDPQANVSLTFRINGTLAQLRLDVSYTETDGAARHCSMWRPDQQAVGFGDVGGSLSSDAQAFEISIQSWEIGTLNACSGIVVKGWVRAKLLGDSQKATTSETGLDYNATLITCRPRLKTQRQSIRISPKGDILSSTSLEPPNYQLPVSVNLSAPLKKTLNLFSDEYGAIDPLQWRNNTLAMDWFNYGLKTYMGNGSFLDPSQPVPPAADVVPAMSALFSRLFAVQMYLYRDFLEPASETSHHTIPATAYHNTRRIFISKPAVVVTQTILTFDVIVLIIVLIIFLIHLPKPFLPRMPFTIASQIAYFAGSRAAVEVAAHRGNMKGLDEGGARYGFGTYIGKDGAGRVGIEKEEFIIRDCEMKWATWREQLVGFTAEIMAEKSMAGCVRTWPGKLLRLEGACLAAASIWAYRKAGGSWWFFASGIFVPGLSMVGYFSDPVTGAAIYNLGHTESIPILLLCAGLGQRIPRLISIALIWLAHINLDRMIGAGLKYGTGFSDTHVGFWDGFRRRKV